MCHAWAPSVFCFFFVLVGLKKWNDQGFDSGLAYLAMAMIFLLSGPYYLDTRGNLIGPFGWTRRCK
jgi:hypothetical protein